MFGSKLKAQIEKLTQANADQAAQLAELRETADRTAADLEAATAEKDRLAAELKTAQADNLALKASLGSAQAKVADLESQLRTVFATQPFKEGKGKPAALADVSDGQGAPLPEAGAETDGDNWAAALAAEGSYAEARRKHPAAFAAAFPELAAKL